MSRRFSFLHARLAWRKFAAGLYWLTAARREHTGCPGKRRSGRLWRIAEPALDPQQADGCVPESPALDIIELPRAKGAEVRYHDPYVLSASHKGYEIRGEPDLDVALAATDCVILIRDHSSYDWAAIRQKARLVDKRNAMNRAPERVP
jgi:hypothetical protein